MNYKTPQLHHPILQYSMLPKVLPNRFPQYTTSRQSTHSYCLVCSRQYTHYTLFVKMSNDIICPMNIHFCTIFISDRFLTGERSSCAHLSGFQINQRIVINSIGMDRQFVYPSFLFIPGVPKKSLLKIKLVSAVELDTARTSLIFSPPTHMA